MTPPPSYIVLYDEGVLTLHFYSLTKQNTTENSPTSCSKSITQLILVLFHLTLYLVEIDSCRSIRQDQMQSCHATMAHTIGAVVKQPCAGQPRTHRYVDELWRDVMVVSLSYGRGCSRYLNTQVVLVLLEAVLFCAMK